MHKRGRRSWRPGPGSAVAAVALVLAGGGVGWAAGADSSDNTVSSCTSPASAPGGAQLSIVQGSCPVGDTQGVQWSQQGPQGAPGLAGAQGPPGQNASEAIAALAPASGRKYSYRFAVDYAFAAIGNYQVDGSVTENVNTVKWSYTKYKHFGIPGITCYLLAGPDQGQLSERDQETQYWAYFFGTINRYYPLTINGPYGAGAEVKVTTLPYTARFQCEGTFTKNGTLHGSVNLPNTVFASPTITVQPVSTKTLSISKLTVIGPVRPVIGPGPGPR